MLETTRVLKPGGRLVATFFLGDDESRRLMPSRHQRYQFPHLHDGYRSASADREEAAIALDVEQLDAFVSEAGLEREGEPVWGEWSGRRPPGFPLQDWLVFRR